MNETLQLDCGPADDSGRRLVLARCQGDEHRDRFNIDDAFRRKRFAEASLSRFRWPLTQESLADIDAQLVRIADAEDSRTAAPLPTRVAADSVCLADVPVAEIDWLWPRRVAVGKVTLLAGDPGLGKSFVTLDMASRVSTGAPWPRVVRRQGDKEKGRQGDTPWQASPSCSGSSSLSPCLPVSLSSSQPETGGIRQSSSVVLLSAEDDLADTVRPRLEAAGADCSRIVAIRAIDGNDAEGTYRRTFELGRDLAHLTNIVEEMGDCRLVVIDPISAYLGRAGENLNAEVRALMGPLADLASRYQLAVVAVTHLRKGEGAAIYRAMGSLAFVAAARSAWMITKDPHAPQRRLLLPMKNNLGNDVGGLAYTIVPRSDGGGAVVEWSDEDVRVSCDEPASPNVSRLPNERQKARHWLAELLENGPMPTTDVHQAAVANGFSVGTIRRAFRDIDGKAEKQGNGGWLWRLPEQDAQDVTITD
jgi:putative DNA primase/helicase